MATATTAGLVKKIPGVEGLTANIRVFNVSDADIRSEKHKGMTINYVGSTMVSKHNGQWVSTEDLRSYLAQMNPKLEQELRIQAILSVVEQATK